MKGREQLQGMVSSAVPLYLHAPTVQGLSLDDAQRLCVHLTGGRERYVPLHLVSRLVCHSRADISSQVWIVCMRRGVPVSIMEPNGQVLGWCLGARRVESSLRQLLLHALDDPMWPEQFARWHEDWQAAVVAQTMLMCGVPGTAAARNAPRVALCNAHLHKHGQACGKRVDALAQLARQALVAHLARETGEPVLLAWRRPGFNLLDSLGQLLAWHAHTDVHHGAWLAQDAQLQSWAVRHYERHAAHWEQRLGQLVTGFEQFLREHWL